jgi:hypothetical protein
MPGSPKRSRLNPSEMMENQPELFAQHSLRPGCCKSVAWWGQAGRRRPLGDSGSGRAISRLDQLALLRTTLNGGDRSSNLQRVGRGPVAVKGYAAPETGEAYARARKLWEQLGSPSEFLRIPYGQSLYHAVRGELDVAQRLDEDLLRLSYQSNDSAGLVLGHASSGRNLMFGGSFAASRSHLEEVLALYDPTSHRALVRQAGFHPHINSGGHLGVVLFCLGYPDQASAQSSAAIAEARRLAHPPSIASLALGTRLLAPARPPSAVVGQLIAVTTEQGLPHWHSQGTSFAGGSRSGMGMSQRDIAAAQQFSDTHRNVWMPYIMPASQSV